MTAGTENCKECGSDTIVLSAPLLSNLTAFELICASQFL